MTTTAITNGLRVVRLSANNVMRLSAVEITPEGDVVVVGGRNAQGKSSVLQALWLALGGGAAAKETTLPIRDGQDRASVELDLGDFIVTRTWTKKGTHLILKAANGARFDRPQEMLDALIGQLSFDPLAFTRLKARDQRDALLGLVDLDVDLDALQVERDTYELERLETGRAVKALGEAPDVDKDLPSSEESAIDLLGQIGDARALERDMEDARTKVERLKGEGADLTTQISRLKDRLAKVDAEAAAQQKRLDDAPALPDIDAMEMRLISVQDTNAAIRANEAAKALAARIKAGEKHYAGLTAKIKECDQRKSDALAAARFPVEGMSFDDTGVLYRGVPFSQASSAEQIRVSLAMAMATSPRLRVLRIKDGSLLDADAMATIREQVSEGGFQLWIERVGDADQGAVIIEDGMVQP